MKKFFVFSLVLALLASGAVFAENENKGNGDKNRPVITLTADQKTCIKNAISKREDALIAGHDAYALAVKNAYTVRKAALLAAWDKADRNERRSAVRAADQAFHDAVKSARKAWSDARRAAWKTFETDRRTCVPQGSLSSSETGASKDDASL